MPFKTAIDLSRYYNEAMTRPVEKIPEGIHAAIVGAVREDVDRYTKGPQLNICFIDAEGQKRLYRRFNVAAGLADSAESREKVKRDMHHISALVKNSGKTDANYTAFKDPDVLVGTVALIEVASYTPEDVEYRYFKRSLPLEELMNNPLSEEQIEKISNDFTKLCELKSDPNFDLDKWAQVDLGGDVELPEFEGMDIGELDAEDELDEAELAASL